MQLWEKKNASGKTLDMFGFCSVVSLCLKDIPVKNQPIA